MVNLIARLGGQRFVLVDPDDVEDENVAPGWFLSDEVGEKKVAVIQHKLTAFYDVIVGRAISERFHHQRIPSDVVIVCTDDMASRKTCWRQRHYLDPWRMWVDLRMGFDQCSLYCVVCGNVEYEADYERSLELPQADLPCGQKATAALTVGMLPGMLGTVLYRTANGWPPPKHLFYKMREAWWTCVEPRTSAPNVCAD